MTNSKRRTTGTAIVEALAANGVEVVFGIPGTHNIELYRGFTESGVQHVVTRHEQGAAYAADAFVRSTGRPGVVVTTSGPGITNALTGLANAYADSLPVFAISPGIPLGQERLDFGWMHEVKDQRAAIDNIVERSIRPATPQQAVDAVHETFARWKTERPRPVHLEVPYDVMEMEWDGEVGPAWTAGKRASVSSAVADSAVELLKSATRVVIVVGGGASDDSAAITRLAEALDAPVMTSAMGKAVLCEEHPLSIGAFAVSSVAKSLLADADCVLALGTELNAPGVFSNFSGSVIRVDIDAAQLNKNVRATLPVLSSIAEFIPAVLAQLGDLPRRGGEEFAAVARRRADESYLPFAQTWREIQLELKSVMPENTIVTGDSSQVSYLGTSPFWRMTSPRSYISTDGYATLGYALPAAIGTKLANPERPVMAMVGDGAFMFSVQEMITAAELGLAIPIVVVDNRGYAEIKANMKDAGIAPLAVDLLGPDFVKLAESMHCHGVQVTSPAGIAAEALAALDRDKPTLILLDLGAS